MRRTIYYSPLLIRLQQLIRVANEGDFYSQHKVGQYYEGGIRDEYHKTLLEKDEAMAVRYYKQAADRGYPPAQGDFGRCLFDGVGGLERDTTRAMHLLARAAHNGDNKSLNILLLPQAQVDETATNTPLTARQIVEVITALSQNSPIAAQKIAQDDSTLIIDLVDASQSVLSLDGLSEIARVLSHVPGIDIRNNESLIEISSLIEEKLPELNPNFIPIGHKRLYRDGLQPATSMAAAKLLLSSDDKPFSEQELSEIGGQVALAIPSSAVKDPRASGVAKSEKSCAQSQLS